ncbi:zinc finger protein ZFP2-like [Cydia fagiglandana]|uniref:zinc finger protein ZFP2-like n=1 Tax=Cydia fagiglandana TaxID=1458189 RepID=UPI002FEDE91C
MNVLKNELGPDTLLACRICLAWDTKLYRISRWGLDQMFTDVMGTRLSAWDGLPQHICTLCGAALLKAHTLRQRCRQAEELLKQVLLQQQFITNKYIQTIDRSAYKLTYNLNIHHQSSETCIHQDTEINIKEEIDTDYIENDVLDVKNDFVWPGNDNDFDITVESVKIDENNDSWPDNDIDETNDVIKIGNITVEPALKDSKTKKNQEHKRTKKVKVNKKQKLTKKNKFSTEGDIREFEEKYDFEVKCLTEEEMVEDMERRKLSEKYLQGEFKCELCCRGFSTSTAYENHVKDKHDPSIGPNECHLCHARYRFAVNRNQHIQDAHRLQFRCRRCDRVLPGEPHAVEHAASHDGATFKCRHCEKRFHKKTTCATHMRLDHPVENAAGGTCEVCGETFISRTGLNCHKTRAHNKPYDRKLHCRKCRIQFDSSEALQRHKVDRPGNKCDPHGSVCCACGEWSVDADALVLHRHRKHGTALFTCDECSKSFLSKISLCTHMDRVHRGVRPARLARPDREHDPGSRAGQVCETCGKIFQCLALLKQHQSRHTGEKAFKCEICPKSYATAAELRTHHVRHTGEKPYKCESCAKCYGTAAALKVHVEAVHIRLRNYRCDQCPKTFLRATGLYVHKVVHTGEKRFECALCGAKFTQAGSLATHRKYVHLKLKPPPRKRNKPTSQ